MNVGVPATVPLIVIEEPLIIAFVIVLFLKVSVVFLPTNVSSAAGKFNVWSPLRSAEPRIVILLLPVLVVLS